MEVVIKMKKTITFILVFSLILMVCMIPVSAATSGSNKSSAIYVTTKANWLKPGSESITITPKQGVAYNGTKFYCSYSVCVYRYGNGTTKYYTLDSKCNGKSLKINLARNASYKITVTPSASYKAICEIKKTGGKLKSYPSWYVSNTNKISSIG